MWLKSFAVLMLACIGGTLGDLTGTDLRAGTCVCVDGSSSVPLRNSACGSTIGHAVSGECFPSTGLKQSCILNGTFVEFRKLLRPIGVWAESKYLSVGSVSQCQTANAIPDDCPNIVTRAEWGARPPKATQDIKQPIPRVFIHHTETPNCLTRSACITRVKSIQNYHMDTKHWNDIGYNFLVGEDGNAYEGRGWDYVGAQVRYYNSVSVGISVIGNYDARLPNAAALNAVKQLVACGVAKGKLASNYTIHGHRDGGCTDCPGETFYQLVRTWPHYGGKLPHHCQTVPSMNLRRAFNQLL